MAARTQAYNDHDLEGFLALYRADTEIYDYPATLLGKGTDHLRTIFAPLFAAATVHVTVTQQFANDTYVVNAETVTYATGPVEYISIYEVRDRLIAAVRFIRSG